MQTRPEAAQAAVGHADTTRGSSACCRTDTSRIQMQHAGHVWAAQNAVEQTVPGANY